MNDSLQKPATGPTEKSRRRFLLIGGATVAAVYLLIAVGGVVRATGSGMGCPDWPRCFGQWVPPTDVTQLPADYQTRYAIPGHVPVFNAFKTWTEYLNRLLGVLIGLLIFGTLLVSLVYWRTNRKLVWASLAAFILVAFQGWLGARVVASVLTPWVISVHMLVALVIVSLLLYVVSWPRIQGTAIPAYDRFRLAFMVCILMALTAVQFLLGIFLRQEVDALALQMGDAQRSQWLDAATTFITHRGNTWMFLIVTSLLFVTIYKLNLIKTRVWKGALAISSLLLANILVGVILYYAGFPAWAQPLHLLLGTLLVGAELVLLLLILKKPIEEPHATLLAAQHRTA